MFNGLLYGVDMAPAVKQGAEEDIYRLDALATHASVNGEPLWQTPEAVGLLLDAAEQVAALSLQLMDARDKLRFWRYVYLTMCVQFLVVTVAAVWGWAR